VLVAKYFVPEAFSTCVPAIAGGGRPHNVLVLVIGSLAALDFTRGPERGVDLLGFGRMMGFYELSTCNRLQYVVVR
jgi:hypothetical protein